MEKKEACELIDNVIEVLREERNALLSHDCVESLIKARSYIDPIVIFPEVKYPGPTTESLAP